MIKPAFIDLSHHNTIPASLKPASEAGILGVIHKLTEGSSYVDQTADNRYHLAKQAGLLWGLYHFVRPGDMKRQASFFATTAADLGVLDDATLLCLDYEDKGVSLDDCVAFLTEVEKITDHEPILYSGHVLKEALAGKADPRLSGYRLWLAQYGPKAELPPGWSRYWGWQYTESGSCPGISPPVDLNAFDGDAVELRVSWSGAPDAPAELVVTVDIKVPKGVKVVVKTLET